MTTATRVSTDSLIKAIRTTLRDHLTDPISRGAGIQWIFHEFPKEKLTEDNMATRAPVVVFRQIGATRLKTEGLGEADSVYTLLFEFLILVSEQNVVTVGEERIAGYRFLTQLMDSVVSLLHQYRGHFRSDGVQEIDIVRYSPGAWDPVTKTFPGSIVAEFTVTQG